MSARTAQASKAIRLACIQEQELVREGKGTRDWTPEQQQNILERGRAYDETGRAFEGHHMKSVSAYPEYQGDPNNIQFLSREEHIMAHLSDVHNPTNGYYDPTTGNTVDFGDNPPIPCSIIKLSNPITVNVEKINTSNEDDKLNKDTSVNKTINKSTNNNLLNLETKSIKSSNIKEFVNKTFSKVAKYYSDHQEGIDLTINIVSEVIPPLVSVVEQTVSSINDRKSGVKSITMSSANNNTVLNRDSPVKHNVSGYTRIQNGKTVHVKPYVRGGNK